jgi:hypothetical protein
VLHFSEQPLFPNWSQEVATLEDMGGVEVQVPEHAILVASIKGLVRRVSRWICQTILLQSKHGEVARLLKLVA